MEIDENCPYCGRTLPTELKARMNHLISCNKKDAKQKDSEVNKC